MKKLSFNVHKEWFDMHQEDKGAEYRAITPYWCSRLLLVYGSHCSANYWKFILSISELTNFNVADFLIKSIRDGDYSFKKYDIAEFSNGMKPLDILPRFQKEILNIDIGYGKTVHGAPENEMVFIIDCKKAINKKNC